MHAVILAVLIAASQAQATDPLETAPQGGGAGRPLTAPAPDAPPIVDIALRTVRAAGGGSSVARSAARGDEPAFVSTGLGPCVVGASREDPARENSITWRASGRVRSVERGIAVADVEWQRLEYRPSSIEAGPRVRTTLTLPLGERVAVDFVDTPTSPCRMDALIFEIGVAADHGARLAMSAEGRSGSGAAAGGTGRGGGGVGGRGVRIDAAQIERRRQGAEASAAAPVVTRPMPPRQYTIDVWLVPAASGASTAPALSQRLSQVVGGTGGRFEFPPIPSEASGDRAVVVEISALVIPIGGEQLMVAITRHLTPGNGASPVSVGWIKAVPLPKASAVLSFEIPAADGLESANLPKHGYGLRMRIAAER